MALTKCPRCELNYILDGGSLCTVCRREVRGEQTDDEVVEMGRASRTIIRVLSKVNDQFGQDYINHVMRVMDREE